MAEALANAVTIKEPFGALIDYALVNAQDPSLYSFIPETEAILALKPGRGVKIGLEGGANPEHFWVMIVERRGVHGFVGKVQNTLLPGWGIDFGDHLIFCGHHIREIERV